MIHVLLLGGGAQGRATLYDLLNTADAHVVVADTDLVPITAFAERMGLPQDRFTGVIVDANDTDALIPLFEDADVVIDLLPTLFRKHMTQLAIQTRTDIVNTSFHTHVESLANEAHMADIIVMPEAGLDPGIDLVLAGEAVRRFDRVERLVSACGGVPTKEACDNPLNYKVSWNFEGVLSAYKRPGDLIRDGKIVPVDPAHLFAFSEEIEVEGVGRMDRYPNGYASTYATLLGLHDARDVGRYTLRWAGHAAFWKQMIALGLLDDEPVLGISPKQFLARVLEPRLQYGADEKDLVVLQNVITGVIDGEQRTMTQTLIDERDLDTGLMAMNRTVGFTASIVAQMVCDGTITRKGVLSPTKDIPYEPFIRALTARNIRVEQRLE